MSSATQNNVGYAYSDVFLTHDFPRHPESATRLRHAMAELRRARLLQRLVPLPVEPPPDDLLTSVHDPRYLAWLRQQSVDPPTLINADTYICAGTYDAATHAAGAAIQCIRAVLTGYVQSAVALVRPPGHHACRALPLGFCYLNNVAHAATYAIKQAGLEKIVIFDFDVHHGNGTQEMFYDSPHVLYISLHQSPLFPGTGSHDERGRGPGEGLTVNIPLPPGAGDTLYLAAMDDIVAPIVQDYRPEAILVSAGYDGHWRDHISHTRLTISGYDSLTKRLISLAHELCRGRLMFVLEGGYDLQVLATCLKNLSWLLLGAPEKCEDPVGPSPYAPSDDLSLIRHLRRVFSLG